MRNNGSKSARTLELEREPITLSEVTPELEKIASDNSLTLKNDWSEVVRIFDQQNLNR